MRPKEENTIHYSFTLDKQMTESFSNLCKQQGLNMSWIIETFIREYNNGRVVPKIVPTYDVEAETKATEENE